MSGFGAADESYLWDEVIDPEEKDRCPHCGVVIDQGCLVGDPEVDSTWTVCPECGGALRADA